MVDTVIGNALLNRFRVDALIEGGIPNVYRAWDLENNIPVVIKEIPEDATNNLKHLEESKWRPQSLSDFTHPNIVPIYGFFRMNGTIFIVEAFIEGVTLKKYLYTHSALSIEDALIYMKQLCDALFYAHSNGVIHGNLRLGNILIKDNGNLLLADFGISLYANDHKPSFVGGNLKYATPEQIKGESITLTTDIYVVGIILFEMLTGEHPFQRIWESLPPKEVVDSKNNLLRHAHLKLKPINPSEIKPGIPEDLSKEILRALDKDSSLRHLSVQDFFSLISAQNIQQNKKILKTSPESSRDTPSLFKRFLSMISSLPLLKEILSKSGKTELAIGLLDEYELVFPLIEESINFDDIFVNRVKEINQMHVSLKSTRQGIVLVIGHRRTGKTVYVKTALDKLGHRLTLGREILISVSVDLPSIPKPEEVLHLILIMLKGRLEELEIYNSLNKTITKKLDDLIFQLGNDIKTEKKTEKRLSVGGGVSPLPSLSIGMERSVIDAEWREPKESFFVALQTLCQILRELQGSHINYQGSMAKPRIILTFDELDKVENITAINMMLNNLKPLFSSAGVHFILIINVDQFIAWTSQQKDRNIYDSLNSGRDIYIDCMWDMRPLLSLVVNENKYYAKDDILFNPVEFFQHYLKYLSVKTRGNLDKLWHDYITRNIKEYGEGDFLVFSREDIREIKLYSGLYDIVMEIIETEMGDEVDRRDRDIAQIALCQTIVNVLDSKKYGVNREDIIRSIKVSNHALEGNIKKMVEALISKMLSKEYVDQSEQTYYLKKRRVIEKGSHISAPFGQIVTVSNVEVVNVEERDDLLATEQREFVTFLPPVTNIHAILRAMNNILFLTVTDKDPMRFSYEEQRFYEKIDIGRGSENDLQIHEDKNVSRYHLRLVFSEDGWYVHDMNTANGTLINGIPTTQTFLSDEDIIFLGNTVIKFLKAEEKGR